MDGVLLDGSIGLEATLQWTISKCGLRELCRKEIDIFFRLSPLQRSFADVFGTDTTESQKLCDTFRAHFKSGQHLNSRLYDGVKETLENLKMQNFRLGIASFKREDYLLEIVRHFEIDKYFDAVCGADADGKLTKADIITNCAKFIGAVPEDCVYVGDTKNDAKSATMIGMKFIAVTYGFGFKTVDEAKVCSPLAALHDISELIRELS
jgi:phosphoglycolate phosphatase